MQLFVDRAIYLLSQSNKADSLFELVKNKDKCEGNHLLTRCLYLFEEDCFSNDGKVFHYIQLSMLEKYFMERSRLRSLV